MNAPPADPLPPPRDERDPPPSTGLEELGPEDVRLPQLKLRQPQTRNAEAVPEGRWFLTSQPAGHAETRAVVLLSVRKERALLLPFAGGEVAQALAYRIEDLTGVQVPRGWSGPVCFSHDRVRPVIQDGIRPLAEECATCPMARWRTARGRRVQDCAESYRLVLFDLQAQLPCLCFARGSGIRPARDLLTALQVASRRLQRPARAFRLELRARPVESEDGTYFAPVFGRPELIEDPSQVGFLAEIQATCGDPQPEED